MPLPTADQARVVRVAVLEHVGDAVALGIPRRGPRDREHAGVRRRARARLPRRRRRLPQRGLRADRLLDPGPARLLRVAVVERDRHLARPAPGPVVRRAPQRDPEARVDGLARARHRLERLRLAVELLLARAREGRRDPVELGHVHGEPERADPPHRVLGQELQRAVALEQVVLEPDPVERHPARDEVLGHRLHRAELRVRDVRSGLVVEELRAGVGGARGPQRELDPLVADHPLPQAVAPRPVRGERLVDHVPRRHAALEVVHHRPDVILHHADQLRAGPGAREQPRREHGVVAPDQRRPVHRLAVRAGPVHHPVAEARTRSCPAPAAARRASAPTRA